MALEDELRADLDLIQEGDRPLPWVVHSGCSYRRIASETTRENFRSFPDGNVLHAYNQRSDNHPDLSMGENQLCALVRIVNNLPTILAALTERKAPVEVEGLVYVPGVWRCPKCEFRLIQSNLNAHDGTVTARDEPGDKCPNCSSPLWRVTYRDELSEAHERWHEQVQRAVAAEAELATLKQQLAEREEALERCAKIVERNLYHQSEKVEDVVHIARRHQALTDKGPEQKGSGGGVGHDG